ncbi:eCIS core domain-containing protein [Variovorax sp. LjRoot84]|uniref:eCIS core domain-containing protein n=1 Tax=Variovorax sp. LjRoot84 TaxID=3342340 RepID=UPI003F50DE16
MFKESIGPANDAFEREADRIADAVMQGDAWSGGQPRWSAASTSNGTIQRKCAECEEEEEEKIRRAPRESATESVAQTQEAGLPSGPTAVVADTPASPSEARAEPAMHLLTDDDAEVSRGQMRKSEFLTALRADVCAAVDDALSGTGRDSQGCPWIDHWLGYYGARSSVEVERALQRYAPEARGVTSAQHYIRIVTARVRRSAEVWARTGEITGVPEDVPASESPGGAVLNAFGGMFFKARPGGARREDPGSVRQRLGSGQALPGDLRTRMESAFAVNFGSVRLHTDAKGAQLSDQLNARAFTVGPHIAFGAGEFRPGSIAGDALIAHELAHVVQQGGAESQTMMAKAPESTGRLEMEADRSAIGVVASLWGGVKGGIADLRPGLKSGLQLSRCSKNESKETLQVSIKPIRVAEDDGSAPTSVPSLASAKRVWSKCCINVVGDAPVTVSKSAYKEIDDAGSGAPLTAEESALFADAGIAGGVQLAIVDTIRRGANAGKMVAGGGTTKDFGLASAKIILVDGSDPTIVGHELGHAMGIGTHGPAGTVMQPSGAYNKAVDEAVNADICKTAREYVGAAKTGKKECALDL